MKKNYNIDNQNIITLNINSGYATDIISVSKSYLKNNELEKQITFSIWDDMAFRAYTKDFNISKIEFDFDYNDPIYYCLNRLLENNKKLIIDDDETSEDMKKYIEFVRDEDIIKVKFTNIDNDYKEHDKFKVFIKNICYDGRSRDKNNTIKPSLIKFFREMEEVLLEDYHQITMDEHLVKTSIDNKKIKVKKLGE